MNHSTPGLPVHHQLPEFTQTHVHRVGDAIQPSHPLLSPSPPAPNPSQHQSLFQRVNSSHEVAKVPSHKSSHFGRRPENPPKSFKLLQTLSFTELFNLYNSPGQFVWVLFVLWGWGVGGRAIPKRGEPGQRG